MPSFESLPFDVHFCIVQLLDFETAIALKKTNRLFHETVDLELLPAPTRLAFCRRAERFPQNKTDDLYLCFRCARMLPSASFGDRQRKDRRGKNSKLPARDRFCWECARKGLLYENGAPVKRGGELYYLCWKCKRYGTTLRRCGVPTWDSKNYERDDWICWTEEQTTEHVSATLPGLPLGVRQGIYDLLSYRDSIMLSMASKRLHDAFDPQKCPLHDKFRFTQRREVALQSKDPRPFACYNCFRVLPQTDFTANQIELSFRRNTTFHKRRCGKCLRILYCNPRSDQALCEWNNRRMCWKCGCPKVRGSECLGCADATPAASSASSTDTDDARDTHLLVPEITMGETKGRQASSTTDPTGDFPSRPWGEGVSDRDRFDAYSDQNRQYLRASIRRKQRPRPRPDVFKQFDSVLKILRRPLDTLGNLVRRRSKM